MKGSSTMTFCITLSIIALMTSWIASFLCSCLGILWKILLQRSPDENILEEIAISATCPAIDMPSEPFFCSESNLFRQFFRVKVLPITDYDDCDTVLFHVF